MKIKLEVAAAGDAGALVALRDAVNRHFLERFGSGYWIAGLSEKGVLFAMRRGIVFVAHSRQEVIATLTLSTRKPWAIDKKYFSAATQPLYLTAMEVHPARQGQGLGRQCLEEALRIARAWPADAIRLDAYDTAAGAGEFYRKCGFREVGRAIYRTVPLIYFEKLL